MTIAEATALALADVAENQAKTSQHTYRSMARKIAAEFGADTDLAALTRAAIQSWIDRRKTQVRAQTVRCELSWLSRLYRVANAAGREIASPIPQTKKPQVRNKRDRILLPGEQQALRKAMSVWDYSIVEFALQTGLRRLEIWRIRPQDVQLFERAGQQVGMLHIWTSKTGKPRNVPLNPLAAGIASAWLRKYPGEPWLFAPHGGNRFAAANNWANRVFRPALKAAGIKGFTFHLLRHTFATRALQGGARLEQISWALGHSSVLETQSRYAHWDTEQIWPAVMALSRSA